MDMKYNFSEDLKSIREILGISQSEFAQKTGVDQVTVSRNESGNEREYYKNIRLEDSKLGADKVKLAKRQYRGQGRYIDEILV